MCGHGGERMVNVQVLNDKSEKKLVNFLADGFESEDSVSISWMSLPWSYMSKESYKKTKRDI